MPRASGITADVDIHQRGRQLVVAVAVAIPRTRRVGASPVAGVLFVVVFPANIQMAVDWTQRSVAERIIAYGRLPLQIPLIWLALRIHKENPARPVTASDPVVPTIRPPT